MLFTNATGAPLGVVDLTKAYFVSRMPDDAEFPYGLFVHTLDRQWEFSCRDESDRTNWMAALTEQLPAFPLPRCQGTLHRPGGFFQSEWVPGYVSLLCFSTRLVHVIAFCCESRAPTQQLLCRWHEHHVYV